MTEHWFWLIMTAACVVWYSTITIYVAIKGAADIRSMLNRLSQTGNADQKDHTDTHGPES
jgi:hypothetical protein